MRIQTKLFLLLLVIAIGPLIVLSWRGERATESLGAAIVAQGQNAVFQEIENQLSQAVMHSSDLLTAQQRQVEFALRLQASTVAQLLSQPEHGQQTQQFYMATDFDDPKSWPPDTELTLDHAIASPEGAFQAVPVSRQNQAFLVMPGVPQETIDGLRRRLMSLGETYREINNTSSGLFYWQYVSLKEGLHSVYPGHGGYPPSYDPRERAWYKNALNSDDVIWSQPFLDAATRRLLLTAAMPVYGVDGAPAGVTGIDIDILKVLGDINGAVQVGANAESYIVAATDQDGAPYVPALSTGNPVVRVVASSTYRDTGMSWDTTPEVPQLLSGKETAVKQTITDLISGRNGARRMSHNGRESLWVYGSLEQVNSALLTIVPIEDIATIAAQSQADVSQAIFEQVRLAGIASVTLIAVVAVLAMLASRSVTGPLRALVITARGLASGNLEARAQVKGSDEVNELATAFNAMIPQLQNHISVMESLSLAREVQQKLLPTSAPQLPGFEFAGRCVYSEDVGGDYYDFVRFGNGSQVQSVGIIVGDVAGHGFVAALTMTSVRALLRSHAGDGRDMCSAMDAVNRYLAADSTGGRFVTLLYLVIDPDERHMRWVSAGHGPNLIYNAENEQFEELAVSDIPLGVRANWSYQQCVRTDWPAPGLLIMGTDGIWETCNREGQAFGLDGLKTVVRAVAHLSAEQICNEIVETLRRFSDGVPQRDDITLVIVKLLPQLNN